ncbi:MAG TPA: TPM domain-containing protein [Puia sp.]|uniref:TPM domain-containing protein n=1 Tax=Puia sp. TaxID=2045100 RepID=UPI002CEAD6FD|nr:TPM domain-containing protein [Puia sp.]HVU93761.1 TPM domain-containing protein [Puia sp.]
MAFPLFKKKPLFNEAQQQLIVAAIQAAEKCTSGEVRVYVESRCRYVDPLDRAAEVFAALKMHNTAARNGVLVYVALKDRQLAILGDQGIHQKVGQEFWNQQVRHILSHFNKSDYAGGIASIVTDIGHALETHFPFQRGTDTNELPDDIVFGK